MTPLRSVSALLIGLLAWSNAPMAVAGQPSAAKKAPPAAAAPLNERERAEQAVSRLTFGATPGLVAQVEKTGVDKWIDEQLHPEKISDTRLESILGELPAMHLSESELLSRFPPTQVIRNMQKTGQLTLPSDPIEKFIYENQLENYREKPDNAAAKKSTASTAGASTGANTMNSNAGAMNESAAGAAPQNAAMTSAAANAGTNAANSNAGPDAELTPAERQQVRADKDKLLATTDANARFWQLFAMQPGEPRRVLQRLKPAERLQVFEGLTPTQKEQVAALTSTERLVTGEAMAQKMLYDTYSDRQLLEVMTDFWLDHFNVYDRKNDRAPWQIAVYERDTLRPHALGKFEDLLRAVATSPAMMEYLDNAQSIGPDSVAAQFAKKRNAAAASNANTAAKGAQQAKAADRGLNENYARELMELHTLGVDGGYTQHDVTEVAKVFTGWTVDPPRQGGGFAYETRRHEPGSKTVLGKSISESGQQEGYEVLHMLAANPATAHFLSRKLAVHFVSDDPSPALVDRMAAAYLKSDGDIRTTLRAMLTSPEFWSRETFRAKVKTPLEFVVSSLRATETDAQKPAAAIQALTTLGMPIYGMQTPNGYSYTNGAWVSSSALLGRMNFALALTSNKLPLLSCDPGMLSGEPEGAPSSVIEQHLEQVLLDNDASARTRSTVVKEMADLPAQQQAAQQAAEQFTRAAKQDEAIPATEDAGSGNAGLKKASIRRGGAGLMEATVVPQGSVTETSVAAGLLLGSPEFQRR